MNLFLNLPKDVQMIVCYLLPMRDLLKLSSKFLLEEDAFFWKERLAIRSWPYRELRLPTYKDACAYVEYMIFISQILWSQELLDEMLSDEIFLTKYINLQDKRHHTALAWAINNDKKSYIKNFSMQVQTLMCT